MNLRKKIRIKSLWDAWLPISIFMFLQSLGAFSLVALHGPGLRDAGLMLLFSNIGTAIWIGYMEWDSSR